MNKKLAIGRRIQGFVAARDIVAPLTGELLCAAGEKISAETAMAAEKSGVSLVYLALDDKEIKVISNGTVAANDFLSFDATECGINERVNFSELRAILDETSDVDEQRELLEKNRDRLISKTVTVDDIFASINYLNGLGHGVGTVDDIDHLGNRRIRSVGELLQNQFRIGFSRMERVIRERMTLQAQDMEVVTPQALINIRPVVASIKEFFGSSPLSQFMDQNNPLAELTHKRRLSALGPGGLSRDRAGFEVRDVHYSHYGRMCPIETPEGPNIGLISYLATFARINEYGFIEAPYRKVDKATGVVTDEVVYMTADVEDEFIIAGQRAVGRARDVLSVPVFPAAGAMRSLRSTKSAWTTWTSARRWCVRSYGYDPVPGERRRKPRPHGLEHAASGRAAAAARGAHRRHRHGVQGRLRLRRVRAGGKRRHCGAWTPTRSRSARKTTARPRTTSSSSSCARTRAPASTSTPSSKGDKVIKGQVLADGPATKKGEISLGQNVLIGFMTWEGYNYEDAVLLNERLVREDVYTSIHIEEYEIETRDTKLGPEEITRDIPNVGEDALKDLDERGIIRIGAEVRAGDILVGKVTPKGETELTAEERLLRAIFGEKAREVRDTPCGAARRERNHRGCESVHTRELRRAAARREPGGALLHRPEAQDQRGRQDGRPSRQQGRRVPCAAAGGYALPARRHAAGYRAEPAGRSLPYEHRSGAGGPSGLRRQDSGLEGGYPHFRRRHR